MIDPDGFRPNVGIILMNEAQRVFWAQRSGNDGWQFPQGGMNTDETPEEAMYRELSEETGLGPEHVELLGATPQPGPIWEAASGRLCPVATGAALSDHAHALGAETRLGAITQPLLLLPFAAFLARDKGTISVAWEGGGAVTDGQVSTHGTTPAWSLWATLRLGGTLEAPRAPGSRADPAPEAWASLAAFAHRTYAPATEESRQKGAGPSDTD